MRILLAQARRTQAELEAVFSRFLRRFPLLAPLGAAGTITFAILPASPSSIASTQHVSIERCHTVQLRASA